MDITNPNVNLSTYQKTAGIGQNQSNQTTGNGIVNSGNITIRNESQASFVSHILNDPSTNQSDSLKLTYRTAIEKLNEFLKADLPEGAQDPISEGNLKENGAEYWNPENTAKRILAGATGFLGGFQNAHPELEGEALLTHFLDVVGGGLQQGFADAKDILSDLKVFDEDIESNYDKTLSLVNKGLLDFKDEQLKKDDSNEA